MTDPKIATVQSIYEAFGRVDIGYILDQLTDDVDNCCCAELTFKASGIAVFRY